MLPHLTVKPIYINVINHKIASKKHTDKTFLIYNKNINLRKEMKTIKTASIIALAITGSLLFSGCTTSAGTYTNFSGEKVSIPSTSGELEAAAATEKLIEVLEYSASVAKEKGYTEIADSDGSDVDTFMSVYDPETKQTVLSSDGGQSGYIVDESAITPYVMRKFVKDSSPDIILKDNVFIITNPEINYTLKVSTKNGLMVSAVQIAADQSEIRVTMEYKVTDAAKKLVKVAKPAPSSATEDVEPQLDESTTETPAG